MGYFPRTRSPTNLDIKRKTLFCSPALLIPPPSSFRGLFEFLVLYHCVRLSLCGHCVWFLAQETRDGMEQLLAVYCCTLIAFGPRLHSPPPKGKKDCLDVRAE